MNASSNARSWSGGDPAAPNKPGAVLRYSTELATAVLKENTQTPLVQLPEQQLLYVEGGQGQLDDGNRSWDLRVGTGILIAPGSAHRFTNTTQEPLQMILVTWQPEDGAQPVDDIRVRNIDQVPTAPSSALGRLYREGTVRTGRRPTPQRGLQRRSRSAHEDGRPPCPRRRIRGSLAETGARRCLYAAGERPPRNAGPHRLSLSPNGKPCTAT